MNTNVPELISILDLQRRTNSTERRLAYLIRSKVITPDVVNEAGIFFHRSKLSELRIAIQG